MRPHFTCGLFVLALLGSGCRHHYRHGLRKGSLTDVGATSLRLHFVDSVPTLEIGNEAADGTCLELDGLRVTVDGVPQSVDFAGGRQLGGAKHPIFPSDVTDSCTAVRVSVHVPDDPRRGADVFEVDDGAKLRAEFPNLLSSLIFTTAPPTSVAPGDVIRVSVLPSVGPGRSSAFGALLGFGPIKSVDVPTRTISASDFEMTIPATSPSGPATLYVTGSQVAVPPMVCSARACSAESRHFVEWKLEVR